MLKFHSLRIAELHPEAQDALAVSLEVPQELRREYLGLPGQHIVLRAQFEGEEARRTYSLINLPGEWPLRIVVRVHEKGRMSRHLSEQVKAGDRIDVLPPNGSLTPRLGAVPDVPRGRTYAGFASGCGITPVLSIARAVLQAHPANHFILFYGNTSTERAMCVEELLALKDTYVDRLAIHFLMSREPQETELYNGRLDGGRVREFARRLFEPDRVAEFFVCGPGDMIEQVSAALRDLNVGADRIHGEHFAVAMGNADAGAHAQGHSAGVAHAERAGTAGTTGAAAADNSSVVAADAAEVTIMMDGRRRTFTMRTNDETVLDAAARAGLELPSLMPCRCVLDVQDQVVQGKVEMLQNYALEDWELEQGHVLACQAQVRTPTLELDYDEK